MTNNLMRRIKSWIYFLITTSLFLPLSKSPSRLPDIDKWHGRESTAVDNVIDRVRGAVETTARVIAGTGPPPTLTHADEVDRDNWNGSQRNSRFKDRLVQSFCFVQFSIFLNFPFIPKNCLHPFQ